MKLDGKVAIVTGSSTGIGRATAFLFAKEGAKVVVVARSEQRGEESAQRIRDSGGDAVYIRADVSSSSDVRNLVDSTIKKYGKIDVLFNNAGIVVVNSLIETTEQEWDEIIDINLKSVFLCSKYVVPHMIKNGKGVIVNTSSIYGLTGGPYYCAYTASKGGVTTLTKALALELAQYNIRVNCICPANIMTDMVRKELEIWAKREKKSPDEIRAHMADMQAIKRVPEPEEVAPAVLFLASDDSSFITGASLAIDGGYTAL
jgi:NAD(P)-dependent dehydrogenase (short-subunit alcohol dehydrogenase family)